MHSIRRIDVVPDAILLLRPDTPEGPATLEVVSGHDLRLPLLHEFQQELEPADRYGIVSVYEEQVVAVMLLRTFKDDIPRSIMRRKAERAEDCGLSYPPDLYCSSEELSKRLTTDCV
jgi:hypothetical protein